MGLTSNTDPYNAAAEHFGADDAVMVKTPRALYNFSVQFLLNENVRMEDDSFGRNFMFQRVVSATMPDFDYGIMPVNQYNRMRYVPTRMTPGPANIVFYDTKDNQFQTLLKAYEGHYFGDETGIHNMDPKNFNGYSMINAEFANGAGHSFGAKSVPSNARFFFEEIRIHNKDTAQGGRTTILFNCMVNTIQHTTFDYAQSSTATYNCSFQPEHVNIVPIDPALIDDAQADRQSLESTTASTVAFRPPVTGVTDLGDATLYIGQAIPANAGLQNINGQTFVIPNINS